MKKFLLFMLLVIFVALPVYSQVGIIWRNSLSDSGIRVGSDIHQTSDGGLIIAGVTASGFHPASMLLLKTDSAGNEVWSKTLGDDDKNYKDSKVAETTDNGFILLSMYARYSDYGDSTNFAVDIVKTDSSGNAVWNINFDDENRIFGSNILELSNGTYMVVLSGVKNSEANLYLVNIDNEGSVVSRNSIYDTDILGASRDISLIQNDRQEYLILSNNEDKSIATLTKTDSSGNIIWYRYFYNQVNSDPYCYSKTIIQNSDDNYILAGSSSGYLWVSAVDDSADILWNKNYDIDNGDIESIFELNNGGYFVGRSTLFSIHGMKVREYGDLIWNVELSYPGDGELGGMCAVNENSYVYLSNNDFHISLTKIALQPTIDIETDSVWIDEDWNGFASGTLNAQSIQNGDSLGIVGYEWSIGDSVIGTQPQAEIDLPAGVNIITLKVSYESGTSVSKDVRIDVYSYKIETNGAITASVSTIGDSLFFISSKDDRIYCFSDEDQEEWFLLTGGDIQSTTTIGPNNNIYVGSDDTRLYSFSTDGNFLWDKPMGGVVSSSPSITPGGTLYVGTSGERLYSINSTDGQINWNYLTGGAISSSPSVSESEDIFFGSDDGVFYCVNSQGNLNWSYNTDGPIKSSPAIDDSGNVYFGSNDSYLYALSSTGELNWRFATGGAVISSPAIDSEGNIYFGSADGIFYCVSNSGTEQWFYNAGSAIEGSPTISQISALESDWRVYFGCTNGKFIALSLEGELEWYYLTEDNISASPLITDLGRIYVGSMDNKVYGFAEHALNLLASSNKHVPQWATFQKNNARTGYAENVITAVDDKEIKNLPTKYSLMQNYPNPFNPTTTIQFELPEKSNVVLEVFNILGEKVTTLINEEMSAGAKKIVFNASNLSSGVYFYRLRAGDFVDVKKLTLLR